MDGYKRLINAHEWVIEKVEAYGTMNGVLVYLQCSRCGASHIAITSCDDWPKSVDEEESHKGPFLVDSS